MKLNSNKTLETKETKHLAASVCQLPVCASYNSSGQLRVFQSFPFFLWSKLWVDTPSIVRQV